MRKWNKAITDVLVSTRHSYTLIAALPARDRQGKELPRKSYRFANSSFPMDKLADSLAARTSLGLSPGTNCRKSGGSLSSFSLSALFPAGNGGTKAERKLAKVFSRDLGRERRFSRMKLEA